MLWVCIHLAAAFLVCLYHQHFRALLLAAAAAVPAEDAVFVICLWDLGTLPTVFLSWVGPADSRFWSAVDVEIRVPGSCRLDDDKEWQWLNHAFSAEVLFSNWYSLCWFVDCKEFPCAVRFVLVAVARPYTWRSMKSLSVVNRLRKPLTSWCTG